MNPRRPPHRPIVRMGLMTTSLLLLVCRLLVLCPSWTCEGFSTPNLLSRTRQGALWKRARSNPKSCDLFKNTRELIHPELYPGSTTGSQLSLLPEGSAVTDFLSSLFDSGGNVPFLASLGFNGLLFVLLRSKLLKMLTPEGFAHSLALGTLLWTTLGWRGWTVCVLYLFFGSAVTKVRFEQKEKMGIAEGRGGRRGPENVWGSAFTGLLCAAASVQGSSFLNIDSNIFVLAYVSSIATKLSDTFASEIGKAYGKSTFLITTLQPVPPGTEGAISLEGTVAALFGASLLPIYAYFIQMISLQGILIATIAAFLATNAESLIGATIQGKEGFAWATNEVVNFFNTLIGAALAITAGILLFGAAAPVA